MYSVTFLIPVKGDKDIYRTIYSVIKQRYENLEIIILRNGIGKYIDGLDINSFYPFNKPNVHLRELYIGDSGKGNALNIGIKAAKYPYVCVLDADCVLHEKALENSMTHFRNRNVIAVGGKLITLGDDSLIGRTQDVEYRKTFNITRFIYDKLHASCIISGAFGIFRKDILDIIGGYDIDTVGEDMELVLRLNQWAHYNNKIIIYESKALCYTRVPSKLKHLLHQRERWQRGLLDSLIKHKDMIFNPSMGCLGMVALPLQVLLELLGPIWILVIPFAFWIVRMIWGISVLKFGQKLTVFVCMYQFTTSIVAEMIEERGVTLKMIRRVPGVFIVSTLGMVLQLAIAGARLYGMVFFRHRRLVW